MTRGRLRAAALLALLAWLALALATAAPALAHAVLIASEPADSEVLETAPSEVVLRFNEAVRVPPQAIQVFDSAGGRVDLGDAGHGADERQLRAGLPPDLPDGAYTVTWRAVSSDTHPIRGALTFRVGEAGDAEPVALEEVGGSGRELAWEVPAAVARFVAYAGTLLAVGGAVFLLVVHDRRASEGRALARVLTYAALAAVVATVAGVGLHAVLASGMGWGALASAEALGGALSSGVGLAALARVAGLGLLVTALPRMWTATGDTVVAAGGLVTLTSFLLAGHTALSEPRWLVLGSNLVHTGAAAVWSGGLVLLVLVLRRRAAEDRGGLPSAGGVERGARSPVGGGRPGAPATAVVEAGADIGQATAGARIVRRFSTLALGSVVALTAGGLALAWVEVRSLGALVTTSYGLTLLAKVAVAGLVAGVAAYNRARLVGQVAAAGERAWRRLTRTVSLEAAGLAVVLGITAVLVTLVPARTAAGIGEPYVDYLPLGSEHQVNIVVDPARTGRNEIHLYVLDSAGRLADVGGELTVRLSLPEAGIAPIEREPFVAGPGHWVHLGPEMTIPGTWRVEVRLLVSEFERLSAITDVRIGGRAR